MPRVLARTMHFGFRHLWDTTGGDHSESWFAKFDPNLYRFRMMAPGAGRDPGIRVGIDKPIREPRGEPTTAHPKGEPGKILEKGGRGKEATFKFEPKGLRGGAGKENQLEYIRKRLFSWALHYEDDDTAGLLGRSLPLYEHTRRKGGPSSDAPELSQDKQQYKFWWSMIQHHRSQVDAEGGNPMGEFRKEAGPGFKAPRTRPTGKSFLATYQRKVVNDINMMFKPLVEEGQRDLLKKLGDILTFDPPARKSLEADSEEELGLRILKSMEAEYNVDPGSWNPDNIGGLVKKGIEELQKSRTMGVDLRPNRIDISPLMADAQEVIDKMMRGAGTGAMLLTLGEGGDPLGTVMGHIKERGLEVTQVKERLGQMYKIKEEDFSSSTSYMEKIKKTIQEDVYSAYMTAPKERTTGTIGTQFFSDRGMGIEKEGGYVWSSPGKMQGQGGIFFFSIWKPKKLRSAEDVAIVSVWLPITPSLWTSAIQASTLSGFESDIRKAVESALGGAIRHETLGEFYTNFLGTDFVTMGSEGFSAQAGSGEDRLATSSHLVTRVNIMPRGEVAAAIGKLVEAAAHRFGAAVKPGENQAFFDWVADQEWEGEKGARRVDHRRSATWKAWAPGLGGKYIPRPGEAIKWPQPFHPRPYLWMTGTGR